MKTTLIVPGRPIGANQVHGHHWRSFLRMKTQLRSDTRWVWLEAGRPRFDRARVRITCVFGSPNRRDPQNYYDGSSKVIIDQLTTLGCWPDDAPKYVEIVSVECVYRKGVWQTEIEIEDAAERMTA